MGRGHPPKTNVIKMWKIYSYLCPLGKFEKELFITTVIKVLAGLNGMITSFQLSPL